MSIATKCLKLVSTGLTALAAIAMSASAMSAPMSDKDVRDVVPKLRTACLTKGFPTDGSVPREVQAPICDCVVEKMTDWLRSNEFTQQTYLAAESQATAVCMVPRMRPAFRARAEQACASEFATVPKLKARGEAFGREVCSCVGDAFAESFGAALLAGGSPDNTEHYNQAARACIKR